MTCFHWLDRIDVTTAHGFALYSRYLSWQNKKGVKRVLPTETLYGGSSWWSLNREALSYVVAEAKKNKWECLFAPAFAPDEMFFQTILMNSPLAHRVINTNLRYIDWRGRNGHNPSILDFSDYEPIRESLTIFARKTAPEVSSALYEALKQDTEIGISQQAINPREYLRVLAMLGQERLRWDRLSLENGVLGYVLFCFLYADCTGEMSMDACRILLNKAAQAVSEQPSVSLLSDLALVTHCLHSRRLLTNEDMVAFECVEHYLSDNNSEVENTHSGMRYLHSIRHSPDTYTSVTATQNSLSTKERMFVTNARLITSMFLTVGTHGYAGCGIALLNELYNISLPLSHVV